jgi:hypothetical protein
VGEAFVCTDSEVSLAVVGGSGFSSINPNSSALLPWREQAKENHFSQPMTMADLLATSMIEAEKRHLTSEIAPRIERALQQLEAMGIIGKQRCLTSVDTTKARWGKEWLAAQWELLPPHHLIQAYQATATPQKRRRRKTLARGEEAPNRSLSPQKKELPDKAH